MKIIKKWFKKLIRKNVFRKEIYVPKNQKTVVMHFSGGAVMMERQYLQQYKHQICNFLCHGTTKWFYSNGNIETKYNYTYGSKNGMFESWLENGEIKTIKFYKNDSLNGPKINFQY